MATMYVANGLGLAAPQVGESIRLIVFDCVQYTFNAMDSGFLINPEIVETSEAKTTNVEGCLSYPGEKYKIPRYNRIKVKYLDLAGREQVRVYSGLAAVVVQHEIDHLDGIVMKDRYEQSNS